MMRDRNAKIKLQASVPRDAIPPIPPGPEGSNGNGLVRVQWVPGACIVYALALDNRHTFLQNTLFIWRQI